MTTRKKTDPETTGTAVEAVPANTPLGLLSQALASGASVEALNGLMDLQERHERNEQRRAFDNAIAQARAELPVILKDREASFPTKAGGQKSYRFEDLSSIARAVDPVLARHGLSYRFRTDSTAVQIAVTCIISHELGHREETTLSAPRDDSGNKNPLQAIGSTVSYLQRYTLKAALGLAASADDDGHSAGPVSELETLKDLEPVTQDQINEIEALIINTGASRDKFLEYLHCKDVAEFTQDDYNRAKRALAAKAKAATALSNAGATQDVQT